MQSVALRGGVACFAYGLTTRETMIVSQYLAAYDIADDRRRTRVAGLLLHYGSRLQKSVFEIQVEPDELPELRRELGAILSLSDAFILVPVDDRGTRSTISWQRPLAHTEPVRLL